MMSFCNSTHVRGGISLVGLMYTDVNVLNLRKFVFEIQEMENYFPRIADGINWIATSDSRAAWTFETSAREFSGTLEATFVNSTRDCYQTCINEFCESIKKGLMSDYIPVYGYSAPAKSGAGISLPVIRMATHDAPSVFFCVVSSVHPFFSDAGIIRAAIKIMVGCAGASSEAPVSIRAGKANPAQFTTRQISLCGGGFYPKSNGGCRMATTLTQKPQFIWIIAAVRRDMPTIKAQTHHITAHTERDARRSLVRDHVCFFAGRIRLEVAHA